MMIEIEREAKELLGGGLVNDSKRSKETSAEPGPDTARRREAW